MKTCLVHFALLGTFLNILIPNESFRENVRPSVRHVCLIVSSPKPLVVAIVTSNFADA